MNSPTLRACIELLTRLPGLGPRQASRLVYHLLDEKKEYRDALTHAISQLKKVKRCVHCFQAHEENTDACALCLHPERNASRIMVVEKDMDFSNIEKVGVYDGLYHILGGVLSPLRPESQKKLRLKELYNRVLHRTDIKEVILATSATPEGDHTARYIERVLEPIIAKRKVTLTRLGRGLSTGSELEYSDAETFKNAYANRK